MSGWLSQLKPNRAAGLFLAHACAVDGIAIGCNVIDPYRDEVAAPQLAIDRKIEQCEIACEVIELELRSNPPDVLWPKWRFRARDLPFISRNSLG